METQFQVELVWNREFRFVPYGPWYPSLSAAIAAARSLEEMGDGASVKKTQVVDSEGRIRWAYGKIVPVV